MTINQPWKNVLSFKLNDLVALVRVVLTKCLMRGYLFGYIEGDLFVRDTAGRPRYPIRGQRGLFENSE